MNGLGRLSLQGLPPIAQLRASRHPTKPYFPQILPAPYKLPTLSPPPPPGPGRPTLPAAARTDQRKAGRSGAGSSTGTAPGMVPEVRRRPEGSLQLAAWSLRTTHNQVRSLNRTTSIYGSSAQLQRVTAGVKQRGRKLADRLAGNESRLPHLSLSVQPRATPVHLIPYGIHTESAAPASTSGAISTVVLHGCRWMASWWPKVVSMAGSHQTDPRRNARRE